MRKLRRFAAILMVVAALTAIMASSAFAGPFGPIFPSYMSVTSPGGVWDVTTLRSPYGPIVPFGFGPRGPVVPFIW